MTPRLWLLACCTVLVVACGGNKNGSGVDANLCGVFGQTCATGADCCAGVCANGMCGSDPTQCTASGSSCAANTDCCTTSCVNAVCSDKQCTADSQACTSDGECCGGKCGADGTCTPLNTTCKTNGNPCAGSGECCSALCNASGVCGLSSFCIQSGDACAHDEDCCGGICNPGPGGLGTCTQPMPGSTNCSAGVDGTVCAGCGDCCSRLCAPYAATGVLVCQPAEGCRINGDLCREDTDCCGGPGTGLPGEGHVTCLKEHATDPVGICRNPMACNPEGDVCHFKNYNTCGNSSARNDCCGGVGNSGVCQLDPLGVPRCYGLGMCRNPGETCAFSGDCCNGTPCVPDPNGILHCGASCSNTTGACTSAADCCHGLTCTFPPGSVQGTCGGTATCGQYGQACNDTNPCCDGVGCNVTGADPVTSCPPGGTNCTCFNPLF
jgi:hypothetical protein